MVMSVTPMVCITLAFGLGSIGLTLADGCWGQAYVVALVTAKRTAKLKNEKRLREIILALLLRRICPALCNASGLNGKKRAEMKNRLRQNRRYAPDGL